MFNLILLFPSVFSVLYDFASKIDAVSSRNQKTIELESNIEEKFSFEQISLFEAPIDELFVSTCGTVSLRPREGKNLESLTENLIISPFWAVSDPAFKTTVDLQELKV